MPTKQSKRVREPGKRLQQILETASQLFYEQGYDKTSVSDIADALQLEKPTLYHYIKSKDEILYAILENFLNELIASLETPGEPASAFLHTQKVLTEQFKIFVRRKKEGVIFFREIKSLPEKHRAKIQALQQKYMQLLSENLSLPRHDRHEHGNGGKKEASARASVLPLAFLGMCSTLIENISPSVQHMEGTLKEMVDFFIRGAARDKEKNS